MTLAVAGGYFACSIQGPWGKWRSERQRIDKVTKIDTGIIYPISLSLRKAVDSHVPRFGETPGIENSTIPPYWVRNSIKDYFPGLLFVCRTALVEEAHPGNLDPS